jgi:hypothetical protein
MTVSVQTPINTSTANGVTSVFPYQFKILAAADLKVTVNGLVRVLDTHYTVDGVGNDAGGNVTFLPGFLPPEDAKVVRRRLMAFERQTNYQSLGDLLASTLNSDQDAPVMMLQQLAALALQMVDDGAGGFVWDAQGFRLINLGDGTSETDAINLRQLLLAVESGQAGAGVGVAPKIFDFTGDGVTTDFPMVGADVTDPLFYDTALAGAVLEPFVEFTILPGDGVVDPVIRLATAPANDVKGFTVLRGYARPYTGTTPITTVSGPVTIVNNPAGTIDNTNQNTIIGVTSAVDVTVTIRANTGAANDWKAGEFFSVMQLGAGKVTLAIEAGGTLLPSPGFQAVTRGQNSVVSASCVYADSDQWAISGDLLATASTPDVQCFTLVCSDEATTNLAVGTDKYRFRMPYGFLLSDVRATVNVAQAAGTVLTFDVKKNGVTIFSTKPTIDNAEFSSTTAATPPVISIPILGDGDLISVDIMQVGTALAKGLKIQLIGQRA